MKPIIDRKYLTEVEEQTLIRLARRVLTEFVKNGTDEFPETVLGDFDLTPALRQELGVFVTLSEGGALRGCIGYIVGLMPLYQGVISNTQNASAHDPRFMPVRPDELAAIQIEISVMTPLQKVKGPEEIQVGRDGVVLKNRFNQGVFLPQVPLEQGWDKTTYLEQLGFKAGLDRDAYQDPETELFRFEAQVFGEE